MQKELKEELKAKKELIVLAIFAIIVFINGSISASITMGLVLALVMVIVIIIAFRILKWILWIFLKPIGDDKEKVLQRENLTKNIIYGIILIYMVVWSIGFSYHNITEDRPNYSSQSIYTSYSSSSSNVHSDLNSCESLRSRFKSCVSRSSRGLECFPGTDIVLPERCR